MDRLRLIFAGIQKQLGVLTVTQKLLIASLCVVVLMTLFLISQYAGSPATVALLPAGTSEDQQKAAAFLAQRGINYKVGTDGKVMLLPEQRYIALAAMTKEQALPGDKKLLFDGLVTQTSWIEDLNTKQTKKNIALQNELAKVIRAMGFDDAAVVIAAPTDNGGIGAAAKKPVAQVAVFPPSGQGLNQETVNALADLLSGSVTGLDARDVAVIDGRNKRSYRAVSAEDLAAGGGTYIEQVSRVEKRLQDKLTEHLRYIPDVIVSVNAIVDAAKREREINKVLPKGQGSLTMPIEEATTTDTSSNSTKGGIEPGVGANVGMSLNGAGGSSGNQTSNETTSTKSMGQFGTERVREREASGKPTKINVTVSVPREYVAAIWKQASAAPAAGAGGGGGAGSGGGASAEPTDKDIADTFDKSVKGQLEGTISPLVETESSVAGAAISGGTQLVAGTVKAFLIPVSMSGGIGGGSGGGIGGGGRSGLVGGGGSGFMTMLDAGLVKTVALGLLAVVALGMMFTMVRKAGKAAPLPTAEELVGIPPALEPGADVVGEAVEGDTAMAGIEIDDQSLKTGKMLEEIGTLVKNNPQTAATVFNRWLNEEE